MTQENLAIVLNRANCCIAEKALQLSKLWSIGSKCYKEELRNLKILNDSVDVLLNQAFTQNSIFAISLTTLEYEAYTVTPVPLGYIIRVTINGVSHQLEGDGVKTSKDLFLEIINLYFADKIISSTFEGPLSEIYVYTIEATCDVNSIYISILDFIDNSGLEQVTYITNDLVTPGTYTLNANGVIVSTYTAIGSITYDTLIQTLLTDAGASYTVNTYPPDTTLNITTNCNFYNLTISGPENFIFALKSSVNCNTQILSTTSFYNIQSGICQGCLTEEQINTLTERVMSICSICNCELTT